MHANEVMFRFSIKNSDMTDVTFAIPRSVILSTYFGLWSMEILYKVNGVKLNRYGDLLWLPLLLCKLNLKFRFMFEDGVSEAERKKCVGKRAERME